MKHDAPEYIQVTYYTACQNSSKEIKESSRCDELMIGEEVEFQVQIKVLHCPDNPNDWKQTLKIFPVGSQEATYINLEMNCDCLCEHQEHHVSNTYLLLKFSVKFRLTLLLGAFAKFRKATVSCVMAGCLSTWNNSVPTGRILMKIGIFFVKKIQVLLKPDKNNGYFT